MLLFLKKKGKKKFYMSGFMAVQGTHREISLETPFPHGSGYLVLPAVPSESSLKSYPVMIPMFNDYRTNSLRRNFVKSVKKLVDDD